MADKIIQLGEGKRLIIYDRPEKPCASSVILMRSIIPSVPIASKIAHLKNDLFTMARSGFKLVPRELRKARRAVCDTCDFWNPKGNLGLGECKYPKCGCTQIKTAFNAMKCPIGKWPDQQPKNVRPVVPK